MRHSHTSRNYAKAFFGFVTIGLAAACADSIGAPARNVSFKAPAGYDKVVGTKSFRVDAEEGATQLLGSHTIDIPAGAICDPSVSTYGATEWDQPCTPLSGSIVITATMFEDNDGRPYVDFQPALRFVPTKEVNLFLESHDSVVANMLIVKYCNNEGVCVDESTADSSLVPRRVANSSMVVRRIKHFSGYMIVSGEQCPGIITQDPDGTLWCNISANGGNFSRRSGYMVASGLIKKPSRDGTTPIDSKKPNDH